LRIGELAHCTQYSVSGQIIPLSLMDDPSRAKRWSEEFINLMRAWSSSYPVTYANAHSLADKSLSNFWDGVPQEGPEQAPREWLNAIFWLNVFSKGWVDGLGRERVLSTPAHLVEEFPNGAVLLVTRPTLTDWSTDEARKAQAQALVHLKPELDLDSVLAQLRLRSEQLAPVEPRFDPDLAPLLQRIVNERFRVEARPRKTAEFNAFRPPEVAEWLPARGAPPSDVENPEGSINRYREMADVLPVLLHPDVEDFFKASPDALSHIDFRLWWEKFPEFYEREKIDGRLFFSVGAYLGELLLRHLGGRWVPRQNIVESQVVIGDRAWLPFLRARHYLASTQSLLDHSLIKYFRVAERHQASLQRPGPNDKS